MRRATLLLSLGLAFILAACSHETSSIVALPNASGAIVQGTITTDGNPLPGATVTMANKSVVVATVVSDANGHYVFANVAPGHYHLKFELSGMASATRRLRVAAYTTRRIDQELRNSSVAEAITVTAESPAFDGLGASSTSMPGSRRYPAPPPPPPMKGVAGGVVGGVVGGAPGGVAYGNASVMSVPPPPPQPEYAKFADHSFVATKDEKVTTFAIDVDRASYSNVRRFLTANQTPPADAVRIEEMVNYFTYGYPQPSGPHPFSITADVASCPWNTSNRLLRIGIQGRNLDQWKMAPNNLVFLLDVSGSMSPPQRLPLIKSAFQILVDQMRPQDTIAIVVYAGAAGLVLPSTSGADKPAIRAALERLQAGGSTAGGQGIELAYKTAQEHFIKGGNNRVILATDGDFNVGISSLEDIQKLIEEKRRSGIFLTTLGVGDDNYRDTVLELLADKGNGNYSYLDSINEAKKVFGTELTGTLVTIAKDVKIQLEFDPATVASYRQIGYENRALANKDFEDDTKDAGELGAGHSVTALYEIVPVSAARGRVATVRLRYKAPDGDVSQPIDAEAIDRGTTIWDSSPDFQFAAAVAEFGMLLRNSASKGTSSYADVLAMSRASRGIDPEREEFTRMVDAVHTRSGGAAGIAPAAE
jgi:Ca-activated chloride channel family protein